MILFLVVAIPLVLLTLAAFFWPLWRTLRRQPPVAPDREEQPEWKATWQVLAAQRAELDADTEAATLAPDDREEALREWAGRASATLDAVPAPAVAGERSFLRWALAGGVGVLAGTALLYGLLGHPAALEYSAEAAAQVHDAFINPAHADSATDVKGMVERLEARLAGEPDNLAGWALLARSKAQLGDFEGAVRAYEPALRLAPRDPDLLADAADVLGMAQGRNLQGEPAAMIATALTIDPQHRKSLALSASAAMQAGNPAAARAFWQRLRATFADGSQDAIAIDQILAQLNGQPASSSASATPVAEPLREEAPAAIQGNAVSGQVELAPALRGRIQPGSTLFIYARHAATAAGAPRIPLAVLRLPVPAFPFSFTLDDSHAMAPGMNLSGAERVDVEARISVSGQATPQTGDLRGKVTAIKTGSAGISIVIDEVQP